MSKMSKTTWKRTAPPSVAGKKLLILTSQDSAFAGEDWAGRAEVVETAMICRALGVPFEIRTTASVDGWSNTAMQAAFCAAVIPRCQWNPYLTPPAGYPYAQKWINGQKPIPAVIAAQRELYALAHETYGTIKTGSTADTDITADTYSTALDEYGSTIRIYCASGYAEGRARFAANLDPGDTLATALVTKASGTGAGKAIHWRRVHESGASVDYFYLYHPLLWVVTALKRAGITPATVGMEPHVIRLDVDDVTLLPDDGDGHAHGLEDLAAWLRTRNAVALCGLDSIETMTPGAKAVLIEGSDVFKCMVHDHTNTYWSSDASPWDTVDGKLNGALGHYARIATVRAGGFNIEDSGAASGHYYLPGNTATLLGYKAMAKAGVRVVRASPAQGLWGWRAGRYRYEESGNRYPVQLIPSETQHMTWSAKSIAAARGATAYAEYAYNIVRDGMGVDRRKERNVLYFHGPNFAYDTVQGYDNPGLDYLNLLDPIVALSGGWVRWAGEQDLIKLATG